MRRRRAERAQSTVEFAALLPIGVLLVLLVLQAGLALRDRLVVQHAVRVAARAVIVEPNESAALAALARAGLGSARASIAGELTPGGLAEVTVTMPPTVVPLVGRVVAGQVLRDSLTVMVE